MSRFRDALRPPPGGAVRTGVIGDLAEYYKLTEQQAVDRCVGWEDSSVEEWEAAPRDTADGIAGFYDTVESWSFDCLWYAYLQSTGFGYPESVVVANYVEGASAPGHLLDLGSGVGVTAQLFSGLGYDVTLADISAPLLSFAQWRLESRGVKASYVHLPADLPDNHYDVVTAFDVMTQIPDLDQTAEQLHRAMRPGGLFFANYDVRRYSRQNAWHLYDDDLQVRWVVQRAGFVPLKLVDGIMWIYKAVPTTGTAWRLRTGLAWLRLVSPPARALRTVRRRLARAALVTIYAVLGAFPMSRKPDRLN